MKDNGTDRDVALQMRDKLNSIATLVTAIDHSLKSEPFIITQPQNVVAAIGDNAILTVKTNVVKSYQWQAKASVNWNDAQTGEGYTTDTFSIEATEIRYTYEYRCKITGLDDSVIYSDPVRIIQPE